MNHLSWSVDRAAGLVALGLLTASTVLGLLQSTHVLGRRGRPRWLVDLHRGVSGLAVAFVAVHVAGAVGDTYIHFGWADVLVPFASGWRPVAIMWGIVSLYLLAAVQLTAMARDRLPRNLWRKVHLASFPLFATALLHAVTAGTDMGTQLGMIVAAGLFSLVAGLTSLHLLPHGSAPPRPVATPRAPGAPPRPAPRPARREPFGVEVSRPGR